MLNRANISETVLSLIPEIAHACGMDESEISALQAECGHYDDTKTLLYLSSLLSFTEHGYLTTPYLQTKNPELADEIKLAKINLDALIKTHLLLQSAEINASLARVESKVDTLVAEVAALKKQREIVTPKKSG